MLSYSCCCFSPTRRQLALVTQYWNLLTINGEPHIGDALLNDLLQMKPGKSDEGRSRGLSIRPGRRPVFVPVHKPINVTKELHSVEGWAFRVVRYELCVGYTTHGCNLCECIHWQKASRALLDPRAGATSVRHRIPDAVKTLPWRQNRGLIPQFGCRDCTTVYRFAVWTNIPDQPASRI